MQIVCQLRAPRCGIFTRDACLDTIERTVAGGLLLLLRLGIILTLLPWLLAVIVAAQAKVQRGAESVLRPAFCSAW